MPGPDASATAAPHVARVRPDDLAAVGALLDGAREEIAVARRGELMLRDGSGPPGDRELAELASDARGRVLVAWLAGVAVGVGAVRADGPARGVARVVALYVEPASRGSGAAEALLDAIVAWCAESGCRGLDASALPGDRETKSLFERAGFTARLLVMHRATGNGASA